MSRVTWDDRVWLQAVDRELIRRVRDAVILGQRTAQEGMQFLDRPSAPGEYPRVVTGWLRQNITFEVETTREAIIGRFGVFPRLPGGKPLHYALYLERGTRHMAPRPWLTLTIHACWEKWKTILGVR
jgi:(2Fe-2S) ferredoxin